MDVFTFIALTSLAVLAGPLVFGFIGWLLRRRSNRTGGTDAHR